MNHSINKSCMRNDIILTIALVLSLTMVEILMFLVNDNEAILFFVLTFLLVKTFYNGLVVMVRHYDRKKGIQS